MEITEAAEYQGISYTWSIDFSRHYGVLTGHLGPIIALHGIGVWSI
jgi:hypothetical protein